MQGPGVTCVGCGVPLIPDTYYGEDLYVSTSGTVGAGLTGNVQTAPVKLNTSNTGVLTFTQGTPLGSTAGTYYTLNQSSGLAVSLSQASPQFQSTVGANLSISNSVSGQICVVECASFGGSLESYNASLNIVSTSTANNGTVSFLGIPAPDVNGLSIPLVITSPGKLPVTDAGPSKSIRPRLCLDREACQPDCPSAAIRPSDNLASTSENSPQA
jgi:NAD-dependent dihydropyrimidine dehydrogenase PreA subunit